EPSCKQGLKIGVRTWTTSTKQHSRSNERKLSGVYLFPKSAATLGFLFHKFLASSIARRILCPGEHVAGFLRKLGENQVIRFAQQARQFLGGQSVPRLECNPLRTRQVRSRNDVRPLREVSKIFRRRFEGKTHGSRLQRGYSEHLPAHFEHQIAAPLDLLRG